MAQVGNDPRLGAMTKFKPRADNIRSYFQQFENYVDINDVSAEKKW